MSHKNVFCVLDERLNKLFILANAEFKVFYAFQSKKTHTVNKLTKKNFCM